jgi:DNA-binding MltR family transcriptional regulator
MNKIEFTNFTADIGSSTYFGINSDEIAKTFTELCGESDRNAVIVATSIIDDILSTKIKSLLKVGSAKDHSALFADNGPFSSLYSKTESLYCLGELSDTLRKDINVLRKMRNEAAHIWINFTLNSEKYSKNIERMNNYQTVVSLKKSIAQDKGVPTEYVQMSPRVCFNLIASLIITLLGERAPHKEKTKGQQSDV